MKTCTRFHFEDVEPGDRLILGKNLFEPDDTFEIVARRAYGTGNFGPVIQAESGETYYLNDYDIIRHAETEG